MVLSGSGLGTPGKIPEQGPFRRGIDATGSAAAGTAI
jgi:hypothetical protein